MSDHNMLQGESRLDKLEKRLKAIESKLGVNLEPIPHELFAKDVEDLKTVMQLSRTAYHRALALLLANEHMKDKQALMYIENQTRMYIADFKNIDEAIAYAEHNSGDASLRYPHFRMMGKELEKK